MEKNVWVLSIFLLSGIVVGGLLGELAQHVNWLWWLAYGENFGLPDPVTLDLIILKVSFGCMFKINIASIIGLAIAIFWYIKI